MKAEAPLPNENGAATAAATNDARISPDARPDVEMTKPVAATPGDKLSQSAPSSSSPPIDPSKPCDALPTKPAPASATSTPSDRTPAPPQAVGGRRSPAENRETTTQPRASSTAALQAADHVVNAVLPRAPQSAQAPRHSDAPTFGPQTQAQPSPSLSQQVSANPARSLSNMAPVKPPAPLAHGTAPASSPANHAPRASTQPLPSIRTAPPLQNQGPHRSPSDQFPRSTASSAPSPQTPFQEPHNPSAMNPYTVDNIFRGGGYHLPDATDSELEPTAYVDQCNRLYAVLRTMHPSVVRRAIRDTWQTSLAGSEAHISFVLNVVMHKCSAASARVAVSKFGRDLVKDAKGEIMSHFNSALLAEIEDLVVQKAPDSLLDKAMTKRLNTIRARTLLNMLARAERLGYDESDIIEENPGSTPQNHDVPNSYSWMPAGAPDPGSQPSPPPQGGSDMDPLTCPLCHKRYPSEMTRDHHWRKKICQKPSTNTVHVCVRCDQSFSTSSGLDYHRRNKVCGGDEANAAPAAIASPNLMGSSAGSSPASFAPAQLPAQPPPSTQPQAQHADPVPPVSTPARPGGQGPSSTAGPPPADSRVTSAHPPRVSQPTKPAAPAGNQMPPTFNPYAHLSEGQRSRMQQELDDAEVNYGGKMAEVRLTISDPAMQVKKLDGLRNSFATKQSMVRKKYGVRLRERRSRAAIEEERRRMTGMSGTSPLQNSQVRQTRSPPSSSDTHLRKKARTGMGVEAVATPSHAIQETPTRKHAASADVAAPMSGGLAASAATPETTDPERSGGSFAGRTPARNGGAYSARPVRRTPQGRLPTQSTPAKPSSNSPMKSRLAPTAIEVISNTDSDTDSDDDTIPAQLPPPPLRASRGLSKPGR